MKTTKDETMTHEDRYMLVTVRRSGRAVAYFCEYRGQVRPMFGSNEQEKFVLLSWA